MRNLQGLVSFVESALGGSFTAAARKLGITPAAVGKNVMRLEQEMQVRLFNRTTRSLRLTPEGEAFLAEAGSALRSLHLAVDRATGSALQASGRVRITSTIAFGRRFVLPQLPRLAQAHPELEVEVALDNRSADLVGEGFDIAVRGGLVRDSSLVVRRIAPLASVLVASPAYLRKHGVPQVPGDLREGHKLMGIRFAGGETVAWRFRKPGSRATPTEWPPAAQIWSSDPEALLDLATAGEGICQGGLLHVAPMLRSGRLKLVLHGHYDAGEREMVLCYPHRQFLSQRVRVVVEALMEGFRQQPDLQLDVKRVPEAWLA
jgi:DNA-binding transcriptional LysR family regulator